MLAAASVLLLVGCNGGGGPPPAFFGPGNAQGTANLPPVYIGPITGINYPIIVNGLPISSTIDLIDANVINVTPQPIAPGGALGGDFQTSQAQVQIHLRGTGALATFDKVKTISLSLQVDSGPRPFFAPLQAFPTTLARVQGQLPAADPDFDLLRITGGDQFGMPSPGHTTLTQQPGGNWSYDSFFDITYRIDFVGHPGSMLTGKSGSTPGTKHIQIGATDTVMTIPPGLDHYTTHDPAQVTFGGTSPIPPIPAGFFDPGSEPFDGLMPLRSAPLSLANGNTDTIIQRMASATLPAIGSTATVPIELIQLSLVSVQPIVVSPALYEWDLNVGFEPAGPGTMQMTRTSANGGTFTATLPVRPVFTFTRWSPDEQVLVLPSPAIVMLQTASPCQWTTDPQAGAPGGQGPGFFPISQTDWIAPGMALRLGLANTIPSAAEDAAVGDMNNDGSINGPDIQGMARTIVNGPLDVQFRKVDANANGVFDPDDLQRLVNILLAASVAPDGVWINVGNTLCDNSRHIIINCPGKKVKVIVRAADINEIASDCTVHYQFRDCQGVDDGDPTDMAPGATRCVRVGGKEQLVVWCSPNGNATACRISYNITPCGPNP